MALTEIEKRVLRKYKKGKVKAVERLMVGVKHPKTGKTLRFTTLNLPVSEQVAAQKLYKKGYLGGSDYLHKLRPTKKVK